MTTLSERKHLKLWTRPSSYAGATWPDYYVVTGQHRDSDRITRSNFTVIKERLEAIESKLTVEEKSPECGDCHGKGHRDGTRCEECAGDGTVPILVNPYESHWAVGHVEWIGLHKDSPAVLLDAAEEMLQSIEDYPLLDESHWSELEYTEAMDYWDSLTLSLKVDYCRDCAVSIFAACRSHNLPDRLYESLTND